MREIPLQESNLHSMIQHQQEGEEEKNEEEEGGSRVRTCARALHACVRACVHACVSSLAQTHSPLSLIPF